ncbi:hypothetical protein POM88_027862 [Heracleum sosnowskyi]|uniref:Uncharacterized protein n=1 Tax=Heracleum sosnowskyi TaxID=360622 RepID=A0AAD8IB10_9APIA|nr:hypothetical protein POM88_027862 [Heracleum sosnowskyi]
MEGSSNHNDEIPSREQRLEWFMTTYKNRKVLEKLDEEESDSDDGTHAMTFRDIASLELDLYESGGFDVQDYSKVNDAGMIHTYYDPAAGITVRKDYLDEIMDCARLAILQYNTEKGTHFDVDHVIKTNVEPVCPYRQPPRLFSLEDVVEDMTDLTIDPRCGYFFNNEDSMFINDDCLVVISNRIIDEVEAKVTSPKWNSWLILENDNDGIEEIAEAEDTRLTRLSPGNHVDVEEIAEVEKRDEYNMKVPASKLKQVHSVK